MTSVNVSNMCAFIIAADRFVFIVWRPFHKHGFTNGQSFTAILVAYVSGVLPPMLASVLSTKSIENTMCILLGNSVTFLFSMYYIITNIIVFLLIVIMYLPILHKVKMSSKIHKSSDNSITVIARLGAVILTNFIPSLTITFISIMAMFPHTIPSSIEANMAFLLFPLNSCLNPIINTFTTHEFLCNLSIAQFDVLIKKQLTRIRRVFTRRFL